jgi:hypothetical protein
MRWGKNFVIGFFSVVAVLAVTSAAKADDVDIYTLEGVTLQDGATASGSFSFDFTTGTFTQVGIDFSVPSGSPVSAVPSFTLGSLDTTVLGTGFAPDGSPAGSFDEFELNNGSNLLYLDLFNPAETPGLNPLVPGTISPFGASDLGYSCTLSVSAGGPGCDSYDAITQGSLFEVPSSSIATPEPPSVLLLLTGFLMLFGFWGFRRRRTARLAVTS